MEHFQEKKIFLFNPFKVLQISKALGPDFFDFLRFFILEQLERTENVIKTVCKLSDSFYSVFYILLHHPVYYYVQQKMAGNGQLVYVGFDLVISPH